MKEYMNYYVSKIGGLLRQLKAGQIIVLDDTVQIEIIDRTTRVAIKAPKCVKIEFKWPSELKDYNDESDGT